MSCQQSVSQTDQNNLLSLLSLHIVQESQSYLPSMFINPTAPVVYKMVSNTAAKDRFQ